MRNGNLRLTRRVALAAAAAFTVASVSTPSMSFAQDKPPVKLGAIFPMSGIAQLYGEMWKIAGELALEDVNAEGGINGSNLELEIVDDQLDPQQSVLLYRRMAESDVVAVLGPISGTSWQNVAPMANSMELMAINVAGVKAGVSQKPWAIRTHPADDTMIAEGVAEFAKAFPDAQRIVIAGDAREASGQAGIQEYRKAAEEHGLEVVDVVEFETRATDFSPVGIAIRGSEPDAVFVSALGPTVLALLNELEVQQFDKPVVVSALAWAGPLINTVKTAGKSLYGMGYHTIDSEGGSDAHAEFIERFLKASKEVAIVPQPANVSSATVTYDTIQMLADVMRESGIDGTTPVEEARQAVMEGMAELETFEGLHEYTMRDTGDSQVQVHLLEADVDGNQWRYALPADQRISAE